MVTDLNEKDKTELIKYSKYLIKFLSDTLTNTNSEGYVLGISGGVDSSLLAALLSKSLPKQYLTLYIPCESSNLDDSCVQNLITKFDLNNKEVNIEETYQTLLKATTNLTKFSQYNIKPRLRMTTLYAYASSLNYLVLGTDNLCEFHVGYFTKYGDGASDVAPLIHLNKRSINFLAKYYGVPEIIIDRVPTASLWDNQTDEKEMQVSYNELDDYLDSKEISKKSLARIEELHKRSSHKRNGIIYPVAIR